MDPILLWILFILIIALLGWLNQKHKYSSKVKTAYRELRDLAERTREGRSEAADLAVWETRMKELEAHPNEFNKLDQEIGLREAFVLFLEKHAPEDERLEKLRESAGFRKDTVWGMKIRR